MRNTDPTLDFQSRRLKVALRVLVACERSGVVRKSFRDKGHEAFSCDLEPAEDYGEHIICDHDLHLLDIIAEGRWDLLIFHYPCTRLCNSGVRWLMGDNEGNHITERWIEMEHDANYFRALLNSSVPMICGENPIPHKYALKRIGRKYDQIIQPWQFGHGETKATCLWLKNLPKLQPTNIVEGRLARVHREPPSPERSMNRSRTYQGIADAMAEQWGSLSSK
jgi:hypothetical protein